MIKKSCKCKCSKKNRITEEEKKAGSTSGAGGDKSTTSGAGGDKSNTRTATSTDAYTQGNVTVTGGAGEGSTSVYIGCQPPSKTGTSDIQARKRNLKK